MVESLDKQAKNKIIDAIRQAERRTSGEIRVHVKPKCGEDVLKEARKFFHRLRMHRTKEHNAVLIFVATESRRFAIVGDEAVHQKVGESFWNSTRDVMLSHFSKNDIVGGIVAGVRSAGEKMKAHFPEKHHHSNGLSNNVSEG